MLSKGSEPTEATIPEIADPASRMNVVYLVSFKYLWSCYLVQLYPTSISMLTTIALMIVGTEPLHIPVKPSYLLIFERASKTWLQFLLSAKGRLLSAWKRMRAMSRGLEIAAPISPENIEYPIFYLNVSDLFSLNLISSSKTLQSPSLIPQQTNCLRRAESSPLYSARTPLLSTTSEQTWKGERLITVLPAASLLAWMTTLTVSTGCMTHVAMLPEMEPTMNGLKRDMKRVSVGWRVLTDEVIFSL